MLDLFSGIGGFSLAGKWAGFKTVQFVENDAFCQKVLARNFPSVPLHGDIRTFHWLGWDVNINLITAGFPCQPFSVAGSRKGKDDERYLWPEVIRIIREARPNWVIAENVPEVVPHLDTILEGLEGEGYGWGTFIIPACAIGAPHKRDRVWIVANRDGQRCINGTANWEGGCLQENIDRYMEAIYQEWPQFVPQSWATFNAQEWLASNPTSKRQQGEGQYMESLYTETDNEWEANNAFNDIDKLQWEKDKPPVPGVDAGVSKGLDQDRIKALGNSIVPQVIYPIMKFIFAHESWH